MIAAGLLKRGSPFRLGDPISTSSRHGPTVAEPRPIPEPVVVGPARPNNHRLLNPTPASFFAGRGGFKLEPFPNLSRPGNDTFLREDLVASSRVHSGTHAPL
jgi:hypothetical protein